MFENVLCKIFLNKKSYLGPPLYIVFNVSFFLIVLVLSILNGSGGHDPAFYLVALYQY